MIRKSCSLNFDKADDDRVTNKAGNVVNTKTLHQLGAMSFHSLYADLQELCDLFGGPAFGDEAKHFTLTRTQRRKQISFCSALAILEQSFS